jgi:MFS family permease
MASPVEQVTGRSHRTGLVRYLAAAVLARTADEGARVALIVLALDRTGSAAVGGTMVATLLIPHVVAAPLIGALVDRARRPAVVLAGAIAVFAVGLAVPVVLLGHTSLWPAYLALAVAGCCGPAVTGGLTSRLPGLVGPGREARAFGLDSLFYSVAGMAGPALVGLIATAAGAGVATCVLAAAAGLGAAAVATLPLPASTAAGRRARSAGLWDGARAIIKEPRLRTLTLTTAVGQLGPGGLAMVATALAVATHQSARAGLLLSAVAVGALAGSVIWTWRPLSASRAPSVTGWAMVAFGLPLVVAAGVRSLPVIALLFALAGASAGSFTAALFVARDQLSAEAVRTQVFTIGAGMKVAFSALGAGLMGFAAQLPVSAQLLLVAASPITAGVAGGVLLREGRPARRPVGFRR